MVNKVVWHPDGNEAGQLSLRIVCQPDRFTFSLLFQIG